MRYAIQIPSGFRAIVYSVRVKLVVDRFPATLLQSNVSVTVCYNLTIVVHSTVHNAKY